MADSFRILLMDKQPGMTSFSSLWPVKKEFRGEKVGHAGTLDSFASGLMVVLIGGATKLTPVFSSFDKEYIAEISFGTETDTLDPEGQVIAEAPAPDEEELKAVLSSFLGKQLQQPPVYSALHVDGKRAYKEARSGKNIEMPFREIEISSLELLSYNDNKAVIRTSVSKGTYIRSLGRDIALRLSSRAHLSALRRLRIGPWHLADSMKSTDELLSMTNLFSEMILNPSCRRLIDNGFIPDNAIIVDSDSSMPYAKLLIDGRVYGYGDKSSGRLKVIARCPWM